MGEAIAGRLQARWCMVGGLGMGGLFSPLASCPGMWEVSVTVGLWAGGREERS